VASSARLCDVLAQRSRPQLFSNALPPTVAASARRAIEVLEQNPGLVEQLRASTTYFRERLTGLGYRPHPGEAAIIPIIVGDTAFAIRMSRRLLEEGVFVTGFGYPVVPEGTARIRVQMSAALTREHLDRALDAFARVGREVGLLG
jgi:glycine C-acetyltransferase